MKPWEVDVVDCSAAAVLSCMLSGPGIKQYMQQHCTVPLTIVTAAGDAAEVAEFEATAAAAVKPCSGGATALGPAAVDCCLSLAAAVQQFCSRNAAEACLQDVINSLLHLCERFCQLSYSCVACWHPAGLLSAACYCRCCAANLLLTSRAAQLRSRTVQPQASSQQVPQVPAITSVLGDHAI